MLEWQKRAYKFIWEMQIKELQSAIERYPNSERYQRRVDKLNELEEKLKALNE